MEYESVPDSAVDELEKSFETICNDLRPSYDYLDEDPFLCIGNHLKRRALFRRYLLSEELNVQKAAARLRATIEFRRDWNIKEYHEPGAASRLIPEENNPGAEIYFADSLLTDIDDKPYLIGRIGMVNVV
jgi:hypothetical protein